MTKVETAKREKYLVALLTSSTKTEAYKTAHISKATANRIEQDPGFIDQYNKVRRQAMTQASDKLQGLASKAVDTLATIMDSEQATPTERTRVAKIILDGAYQAQQNQDILNRLDKLEQEQAEDDQH